MASPPSEIIYQILAYQFQDFMNNDYPSSSERYADNLKTFLRSNLTVSKAFCHISKVLAYRYCNFTTAKRFNNLLMTIKEHKELCNVVEVADFQELTSIGLGRTGEMNKMIKNLTNETVLEFLKLTKSTLREFLACEHIQGDLDDKIIYFLLSPGTVLSVLDFCGCSGPKFTESFIAALDKLYDTEKDVPREQNFQITCLGFNDCTDLPAHVVTRTLKMLPELQKLDLSHTSIDDDTLTKLPHLKSLTHLSLAMCLKLTVRAILEYFAHHPSVTDENNLTTLEWLNLKTSSLSSSWSEVHTMFLLKKLCRYGHNKTLQYLNIGGLPLHSSDDTTMTPTKYYYKCTDTLQFIKWNFPKLKSLSVRDNAIPISKLCKFLAPEDPVTLTINHEYNSGFKTDRTITVNCTQALKYLNVSNNPHINKWNIQDSSLYTSSPSLVTLEISFECWQQIEKSNERHELTVYEYKNSKSFIKDISTASVVKWRCYLDSSYGRRYWIYKTDPYLNKIDIDQISNVTNYDSDGKRIINIVKHPDFLKFAQAKIMLGCGLVSLSSGRRKKCYRDLKPPISKFMTRKGSVRLGSTATPIVRPRLPPGGWRVIHANETDNDFAIDMDDHENRTDEPATTTPDQRRSSGQVYSSHDGLFWDRSIHDLALLNEPQIIDENNQNNDMTPDNEIMSVTDDTDESYLEDNPEDFEEFEENDEEYLNDPALQRRRSQLSLRRAFFSHTNLETLKLIDIDNNNNNNTQLSHLTRYRSMHPYLNQQPIHNHTPNYIYDPKDPITSERYRLHFQQVEEYQVFGTIERGMYRYYSLKT